MAESWEEIVLFHFLHGDSDKGSDLDSSGAWLQDSQLYADMIRQLSPRQLSAIKIGESIAVVLLYFREDVVADESTKTP